MYSLYSLLEIVAEAEHKTLLPPLQFRANFICPGKVHCLQLPYHPATQHRCFTAYTAERGLYSPSTVADHRLASLFKPLGAARIWPHAFFLPPLLEGSKLWQPSSSDCRQQYWGCPFLSRQQFHTCLGQWKNLALVLQICTVTRWYTVVVTWITLTTLSKSVNFRNGL